MGTRKVEVEVKVKINMVVDEGIEIGEILDEMEYHFEDTTTKATIEDTELLDYELRYSK